MSQDFLELFWVPESRKGMECFLVFKVASECLSMYPKDPACEVLLLSPEELKDRERKAFEAGGLSEIREDEVCDMFKSFEDYLESEEYLK